MRDAQVTVRLRRLLLVNFGANTNNADGWVHWNHRHISHIWVCMSMTGTYTYRESMLQKSVFKALQLQISIP